MSVNLTDSQEIWVDQCVRTGWRIYMRGLLTRINQRPENKNIPTFSDVEWKREANQMLHELAKDVTEIKTSVKGAKSRGRGLWQALWHGVGIVKTEGDKLFKE
jgi:hypothetical protein